MAGRDRLPFDVRIHAKCAGQVEVTDFVGWLGHLPPAKEVAGTAPINEWLELIAPTQALCQWCTATDGWYDFDRRYRRELAEQPSYCERLAEIARSQVLWLAGTAAETMQRGIVSLKRHLESLEASRRYRAGWIIGGLSRPIRDEIVRRGGLWLDRHRAWTMPDRESWRTVQRMLPGDF